MYIMLFKVKTYKESRLVNKIATEIGYGFLKFYQRDLAQTYAILDQLQITDLKVKKTRKKITIQITLYRPGIFIGAGGLVIQFITDFIKENNNGIDVEINLKETPSWIISLYPLTMADINDIGGW